MIALAISSAEVIGLVVLCSVSSAVATWAATRWRAEARMDDALEADMAEIVATADPAPVDPKRVEMFDQDAQPASCCFACPSTDTTLDRNGVPACVDHMPELVP